MSPSYQTTVEVPIEDLANLVKVIATLPGSGNVLRNLPAIHPDTPEPVAQLVSFLEGLSVEQAEIVGQGVEAQTALLRLQRDVDGLRSILGTK